MSATVHPRAHAVDLQTQLQADAQGEPTGVFRYRWRCSCGDVGPWQQQRRAAIAARRARSGGVRHVAIAERGVR